MAAKKKNEYLCVLSSWGLTEPSAIEAFTPAEAAQEYATECVDVEPHNEVYVFPLSCAIKFSAQTQMVEVTNA